MNLAYYEDRFSRLNLNKSAGRVSPHKVAMLLAVMDLIESGKLAANRIPFDEPLLIAFTRRFDELSSEGDVNNPHLPFFHLQKEGFWHMELIPGKAESWSKLTTASSPGVIREHVLYAYLDDDLFEFLRNSVARELLRPALYRNFEGAGDETLISGDNIYLLNAAFARVQQLESFWDDEIPWNAIAEGFHLAGEKILLANKARGIFKPKQMSRGVLSIKTTSPRAGRTNIYQDAEVTDDSYRYSLQQGDPKGGGNKSLWEAYEDRQPFIYFHAVAEGVYKAIWPCFVDAIYPNEGYCSIIVGVKAPLSLKPDRVVIYPMPRAPERAYAIRESKIRLFQAVFRENVLRAYDNRCAVSGLPVKQLLDAAHITPDSELGSSTEVTNGIALSKLHHRAYDSNLIGIDADLRVVVSEQLRAMKDGVMLEGLKVSHGSVLRFPRIAELRPDRERLARRFEVFSTANK